MTFNPFSIYVLVCGAMTVAIAYYAWRHRATVGARAFAGFMLSLSVYIVGYSMELASPDLGRMLFWNRIEYIGILTFPTLYLIFVTQYTGQEKWLTRKNVFLLWAVPAVLIFLKFFDGYFHLFYSSAAVDAGGAIPLLSFVHGPLYWMISAYNVLLLTVGNFLFLRKWRHASALYRKQSAIMLSAALVLYFMYAVYLSGIPLIPSLKELDINPFMYTLWGVAIGWAIFRYRLFDLAPVARDALLEMLGDGVVVLDGQFRVVDANPRAQSIFGWRRVPIGEPAARHLNGWIDPDALRTLETSTTLETAKEREGVPVYYEVAVSMLQPKFRQQIGYLIVLHDITERKRIERKLEELSLSDELTGLNNRRGFKILATQVIGMARRLKLNAVLMYIDLDGLKWINDTLGHATGDRALMDAGNVLRSSFRSSDIIARLGGDEFVILALESSDNTGEIMRTRLERQLENHNRGSDGGYRLSLSVGIARYRWETPSSLEALLDDSDRAMFEQKRAKKNRLGAVAEPAPHS